MSLLSKYRDWRYLRRARGRQLVIPTPEVGRLAPGLQYIAATDSVLDPLDEFIFGREPFGHKGLRGPFPSDQEWIEGYAAFKAHGGYSYNAAQAQDRLLQYITGPQGTPITRVVVEPFSPPEVAGVIRTGSRATAGDH